jgi:hypothetical protein
MEEFNIPSEESRQLLKNYLEHYDKRLEKQPDFYDLSDDLIDEKEKVKRKIHIGMQIIIYQMLHELNFIKTYEEQKEIDEKWELIKNKPINGED